jgi:[ribosomal protein S5]-alanine N-acetyltransferase
MRTYFLRSRRLGFSTWQPHDLPLVTGIWGDPEVTQYHGGAWSAEQIKERLDLELANFRQYQIQYWPIFLLVTGEHVGCCGLRPRDRSRGIWELGCQLRRAFWSKGLGREAAGAVIAHSFDVLNVTALHAGHHPSNVASARFLQHLGFRYTHDEFYLPTQLMEPCYLLSRGDAAQASSS